MGKREILFEHDYGLIVDLINRHFEFHGANEADDESGVVDAGTTSARDFF